MTSALFLLLAACQSGSTPAEAPVPAPTYVEPAPTLMAELGIPVSGDFSLGQAQPSKDAPAYFPQLAPGDWQSFRIWASADGEEWQPEEVQVLHFDGGADSLVQHQLSAVGAEMRSTTAQKLGRIGPAWAVLEAKPAGKDALAPLVPPDLLITPMSTTFKSAVAGQTVGVELVGKQSVTVPAGTFEALHVRRGWTVEDRSTTEDSWWVAERGLVARSQRIDSAAGTTARLTVLADFGTTEDRQTLRQVWSDAHMAMGMNE